MRMWQATMIGLGLFAGSAPAAAQICRNCVTYSQHKPSSVVPPDLQQLNLNGDLFTNQAFGLALNGNLSAEVKLTFDVRIGASVFSSLFVNENGLVSFGAPISAGPATPRASELQPFIPVSSLSEFKLPVIAPFYADLVEGIRFEPGVPNVGEVFVQYGFADPATDTRGNYNIEDIVQAVRITWYGLPVGSSADASTGDALEPPLAWAQLLLTDEGDGNFNFEFRTGDPNGPPPYSQPGYGSIAGFALNGDAIDFTGPYDNSTPSYFAFRDGALVTGVPEAATWGMMILGMGLVGAALRTRRRGIVIATA